MSVETKLDRIDRRTRLDPLMTANMQMSETNLQKNLTDLQSTNVRTIQVFVNFS